nr:hypothetical protein [Tanacetum cinerariifolium]
MNQEQICQFTARDENWVPTKERVKINTTNAFTISAAVPEIFIHLFWYTIKKVSGTNSYEFLLANKMFLVDVEVFWKILDIYLRIQGIDFAKVPDDETTLSFLIYLGYKGKKTANTSEADLDVSKDFDSEPVKKQTSIRRVIKKKFTITTDDNIIPKPGVALELGKSISLTEVTEEEAARQVHATHARIMTKSAPKPARRRPSEKIVADTMKALKVSKKTSRRQPGTRGSSKGTGVSPGVLDESIVVHATSKSEYYKEDDDDENIDWVDTDVEEEKDDENDDKSIDLEKTNDEETDDKFMHSKENLQDDDEETDDEFVHANKQVNDEEDENMTNAEDAKTENDDEEIINAAKADAEKPGEVKDDTKIAEPPPTSSSLSLSLGFGNQFLNLSSDTSLIGTVKDTTDAKINSLLDVYVQQEIPHIQSPSVLNVPVFVILKPSVLTPIPETPSVAPTITLLYL